MSTPASHPQQGTPSDLAHCNVDGDLFLHVILPTSCDDTGVAVVSSTGTLLSHVLSSQAEIHATYGGIVPKLAARSHRTNLPVVLQAALDQAGVTFDDLSAVAVTAGPGLSMCLRVGVEAAKDVATKHGLPVVAVNHLEAHALLCRMPTLKHYTVNVGSAAIEGVGVNGGEDGQLRNSNDHGSVDADQHVVVGGEGDIPERSLQPQFPFLLLLVSGGHCQLAVAHDVGSYTTIGRTKDDSVGEAYDKTARLVGILSGAMVNGGPVVEQYAKSGCKDSIGFTTPLTKAKRSRDNKTLDFSYAGLKTQVLKRVQRIANERMPQEQAESEQTKLSFIKTREYHKYLTLGEQRDICASFQYAAVSHLTDRLSMAIDLCHEQYPDVKDLVICGGVAANAYLRSRVEVMLSDKAPTWGLTCPPPQLCTDNGVMVAWAGVERSQRNMFDSLDFDFTPQWPLSTSTRVPLRKPTP